MPRFVPAFHFLLAVALASFAACLSPSGAPPPASISGLPAIDGIGLPLRTVTTTSPEAQRLFNEGLVLLYGFNHDAARARFRRAAEHDPSLAIASWGMALADGPHINNPFMTEERCKSAVESVAKARELAAGASPVERDLITALETRYSWPPPKNRAALDSSYANAMRGVWKAHPDDADVGALFAESMMDLRPWDQWTPAGEIQPGTEEVLTTLDAVLAQAPKHPLANHLYIHAVEASPHPERALPAADMLRTLVPGAGHLVHMPGHIDLRLGRYADAILANERGVAQDLKYVEQAGRSGFYSVYRAHNYHFLAYASMFDGQRAKAMKAARELNRELPLETVREMPDFLDGFVATPYHVMVRFGMWQEILGEPLPPADLKGTASLARYARTVALSSLGRVDEAAKEFALFEAVAAEVSETAYIGNNPTRVVLEIARRMGEGELEYRRGNFTRAFALLDEAVARDDALHYDEPWGWFQPVRHAQGALLLEQGKVAEAEAVYRRDLELHPGNGWALTGLVECQKRRGALDEAAKTEAELAKSWARADVKITASCYCRTMS